MTAALWAGPSSAKLSESSVCKLAEAKAAICSHTSEDRRSSMWFRGRESGGGSAGESTFGMSLGTFRGGDGGGERSRGRKLTLRDDMARAWLMPGGVARRVSAWENGY